jgi:GH15 family glucan-1,4-alpha-glucosidase
MYRPIRDYAIIGNLRSAVLVGKDASIDWAPAPFIDSPSVFAALLDDDKGGYFKIAPTGPCTTRQYYLEDSNVLVTEFETESGLATVTDFIPIEAEKSFMPEEEETTFKIKRRVQCVRGTCEFLIEFVPRFDYGRGVTELSFVSRGILANNGGKRGILVTKRPFQIDEEHNTAQYRLSQREGEIEFFVFRYNTGEVDIRKDQVLHHEEELERTTAEWRAWIHRCEIDLCTIEGRWRGEIVRSALLLQILFFEPVGTIAAAPTTSLPEDMGGVRNWDYRFTWVRDSTYLVNAFFGLGHLSEAEEYLNWLVSLCDHEDPSHLQIMYGLRGEATLTEETLTHLEGYKGSSPVRVGNDAYRQHQWDIYGNILDVAYRLAQHTKTPLVSESSRWQTLRALADHVVRIWREPDEGLWEVRSGKRHFVYSKVMCWVALDRALSLATEYSLDGDTATWQRERDLIKEEVLTRGFDSTRNTFIQSYDSDSLDVALLLLGETGFMAWDDPKVIGTISAIASELSCGDGLLQRYTEDDGVEGKEGAFLLASFWLVNAYVGIGRIEEATRLFEKLLTYANHVGLYAEEIDPETGEFLGNFPQAYTHIGLINSALLLRTRLTSDIAAVTGSAQDVDRV